ncbi:uncharacterized protein [Littorina saxatilis]|uniref:uncharacterized protein isoform X2 n=1 Tax=Littorina saxatilis TaxID=31220 RepID=UPI0038B55F68
MEFLVYFVFIAGLFLGGGVEGSGVEAALTTCPPDYRKRVETCIMEAQVAPQAGGGLSLIINNNTIQDLCDRGLLRKTIDCLQEIRSRCAHNVTIGQELDRLYSVTDWQQGAQLLCEDIDFFLANQECLSQCATSVMTCVLLRTQSFRMGLAFTKSSDHARLREVTCNFAESIVKCVSDSP